MMAAQQIVVDLSELLAKGLGVKRRVTRGMNVTNRTLKFVMVFRQGLNRPEFMAKKRTQHFTS